jgi:hypothetical protein
MRFKILNRDQIAPVVVAVAVVVALIRVQTGQLSFSAGHAMILKTL